MYGDNGDFYLPLQFLHWLKPVVSLEDFYEPFEVVGKIVCKPPKVVIQFPLHSTYNMTINLNDLTDDDELEVIGNEFENSELLGGYNDTI